MEEQSYNSTHLLGHTGPVTGTLYLYLYLTDFTYLLTRLLAYFTYLFHEQSPS